jgi:hypothetical protein
MPNGPSRKPRSIPSWREKLERIAADLDNYCEDDILSLTTPLVHKHINPFAR